MVSLPVYDRMGAEVGKFEIDPTELASSINKQLLHDVVVMYQANQRQGSAKNKTRAEVSCTTKKMYRQKGTGNARAGSRASNIRRGGGRAFPRRPRDFTYRLPKKAVRLATRMAVAGKLGDGEIMLIDDLKFEAPKTSEMAAILKNLGIAGDTLLVAIDAHDVNVYKSTRNIDGVSIMPISDINALAVLKPKRVLMTKAALESFRDSVPVKAAKA